MRVPGLVYAGEKMIDAVKADDALYQVTNVATLPGIVGRSIAMPDIHHGYGFAIGAVAAFDADEGIISPGGVGYDINCGVRLMRTDLTLGEIKPRVSKLINTMFNNVPCGVGQGGRLRLADHQLEEVLVQGARWVVSEGYGWDDDPQFMEENGGINVADPGLVSPQAKKRGASQLGTLGAGNHFLEIQRVDTIYDQEAATTFGIEAVGQILVMIHTGSRGCGHQIATDYLGEMRKANKKYQIPLIDPQLSCAPASSPEGQRYFKAMNCGANFAWANRQLIMHWVRESFESVLGRKASDMGMHLIYDIAHNMAKLETHTYEGQKRQVYVHRKGATRAFGPGHRDVPEKYRAVGQPVLIPGDMGTASYLLAGTEKAMRETFGSTCHGAGRQLSRKASVKKHRAEEIFAGLEQQGVYLKAKSKRVIAEEAPGAYKNIDDVVAVCDQSGISRLVARMIPVGVVKG
ncbi:RNA-splicing ligase RtcB [candidate division GN15 bacterium]|nr:RNA-splicing ligase RtcB [candidate division GN15 bacterium]